MSCTKSIISKKNYLRSIARSALAFARFRLESLIIAYFWIRHWLECLDVCKRERGM